jgi:hypothetical protein
LARFTTEGDDVARALTADEQARYPWATRIEDYVPVGKVRKAAVICSYVGWIISWIGMFVSLILAENIHHAVNMTHAPTAISMYIAMVLVAVGAVLGIIMGVVGLVRRASGMIWWAVAAVVPALFVYLVMWPLVR